MTEICHVKLACGPGWGGWGLKSVKSDFYSFKSIEDIRASSKHGVLKG